MALPSHVRRMESRRRISLTPTTVSSGLASGQLTILRDRLNAANKNIQSLGRVGSDGLRVSTLLLGGNPLRSLAGIQAFSNLETLSLGSAVKDFVAIAPLVECPKLRVLLLDGAPISHEPLYRQRLISLLCGPDRARQTLRILDGTDVTHAEKLSSSAFVEEYADALATAVANEARIVQASAALRLLELHRELLTLSRGRAAIIEVPTESTSVHNVDAGLRLIRLWHFFDELPQSSKDDFVDDVQRKAGELLRHVPPRRTQPVDASQAQAQSWIQAMRDLASIQSRVLTDLGYLLQQASSDCAAARHELAMNRQAFLDEVSCTKSEGVMDVTDEMTAAADARYPDDLAHLAAYPRLRRASASSINTTAAGDGGTGGGGFVLSPMTSPALEQQHPRHPRPVMNDRYADVNDRYAHTGDGGGNDGLRGPHDVTDVDFAPANDGVVHARRRLQLEGIGRHDFGELSSRGEHTTRSDATSAAGTIYTVSSSVVAEATVRAAPQMRQLLRQGWQPKPIHMNGVFTGVAPVQASLSIAALRTCQAAVSGGFDNTVTMGGTLFTGEQVFGQSGAIGSTIRLSGAAGAARLDDPTWQHRSPMKVTAHLGV